MIKFGIIMILLIMGMSVVDAGLNDYYSNNAPILWRVVIAGFMLISLAFLFVIFV